MNATRTQADRLATGLRWLWIGPVAGLACMIALFVRGLATDTAPLVVIAASLAAVIGGVWAGTHTAIKARLVRESGR